MSTAGTRRRCAEPGRKTRHLAVPASGAAALRKQLGLRKSARPLLRALLCTGGRAAVLSHLAPQLQPMAAAAAGGGGSAPASPPPAAPCAPLAPRRLRAHARGRRTRRAAREAQTRARARRRRRPPPPRAAVAPARRRAPLAGGRRRRAPAAARPLLARARTAHGGARVALPARRLRRDDGVRLALRAQAGLEFRPAAIAHALRAAGLMWQGFIVRKIAKRLRARETADGVAPARARGEGLRASQATNSACGTRGDHLRADRGVGASRGHRAGADRAVGRRRRCCSRGRARRRRGRQRRRRGPARRCAQREFRAKYECLQARRLIVDVRARLEASQAAIRIQAVARGCWRGGRAAAPTRAAAHARAGAAASARGAAAPLASPAARRLPQGAAGAARDEHGGLGLGPRAGRLAAGLVARRRRGTGRRMRAF